MTERDRDAPAAGAGQDDWATPAAKRILGTWAVFALVSLVLLVVGVVALQLR